MTKIAKETIYEMYEEMLEECYGETTQLVWLKVNTVETLKDNFPEHYELGFEEYIEHEMADNRLVCADGQYYLNEGNNDNLK